MSGEFAAEDCNMWLVQVGIARYYVMHTFENYTQFYQMLFTDMAVSWVALGLSLITFILMLFLACCKGGLGHMHGILFFWILAQLPYVVVTYITYYGYMTITNQFMLMGLLITISLSVTHFKRHHLLHVDHADIRVKLEAGVLRERRSSCIFFVANFLFLVPLFIVQIYHYFTYTKEPYNSIIPGFAIAIGVLIILFIVTYLVMMIARMPSICSLINHSVHNCLGRMLLCIIIPILVILYINDVFSVMLWFWGIPAFQMTTQYNYNPDGTWNNDDWGCLSFAYNRDDGTLTHFGVFLKIIFNISVYTPLIWTVVLSLGFLSMICNQRKPRKDVHDENAQQRANLVQRNNDINVTDQTQNSLWNSGQTTVEYSRNDMM